MADFTQAVEIVMRREGGFSDEPADRGGKTMYGISQRQYPDLDIGNLTEEQAREIYRRDYWQDEFNEIALQKIAEKLFDGAVNLGKATSVRLLQQALCDIQFTVTIDGRFGAQTLLAVNLACQNHTKPLLDAWRSRQARYYVDIVLKDETQLVFLDGWLKRAVA
jgi:lysozyme family protein